MSVKIGINGFGSIGRRFLRCALAQGLEVVAVNDLWDAKTLPTCSSTTPTTGHLMRGSKPVRSDRRRRQRSSSSRSGTPLAVGAESGVDVVVESTGRFRDREAAEKHIKAGGAKKVVVAAPLKGDGLTCVIGVNDHLYDPSKHQILSNASCTTNCLAPVAKVLDEAFGIVYGLVSTVHAYTNDQVILDLPHGDIRRARSAAINIVPTSTGAASAIGAVLPSLKGKLNGTAFRVPVSTVSCIDLVVQTPQPVEPRAANEAFKAAAAGALKGVLDYTDAKLVSSDYKGNPHSAIVDGPETKAVGNLLKVVAWYDNEWGYSMRLVDLCKMIAAKGL